MLHAANVEARVREADLLLWESHQLIQALYKYRMELLQDLLTLQQEIRHYQVDTVLADLKKTSSELAEVDVEAIASDIAELVENSDTLITETQQGLSETLDQSQAALQKIQSIDIESLNRSIADLQAVISPLRSLFGFR